jgi:hypothetical protein
MREEKLTTEERLTMRREANDSRMMDDKKHQAVYDDSAVLVHTFGHVLRSPLNMLRHTCTLQKTMLANVEEPVFWVDR